MRVLTPPGLAGVAVVRFGDGERHAALACLRSRHGAPVPLRSGGPPILCALHVEGRAVDDVLAVDLGERGVEVHVHGSPGVLAALSRRFGTGTDAAPPAERLLRVALSVEQLDLAIEQSAIDFDAFVAGLRARPPDLRRRERDFALARSRVALAMVQPLRVVLAGAQNAGKSTLFNRLVFRERVLTGPLPGLTRDAVAEVTTLAGYPYELVDTAGEGVGATPVDAAAIERGRSERSAAQVVLVVDGARGFGAVERRILRPGVLVIATKADLPAAPWPADAPLDLRASCVSQDSVGLRQAVGDLLRATRGLPVAGAVGGPAAMTMAQFAMLEPL